jgi:hypothetical protein
MNIVLLGLGASVVLAPDRGGPEHRMMRARSFSAPAGC